MALLHNDSILLAMDGLAISEVRESPDSQVKARYMR